jgi:predicted amidohydrolase
MERGARRAAQVFDTALGRIGVLICYDAEFPLLGRALIEAGVEILLVPSCTEALSGYWRVRIGAMARALEGQCVVVHSPTVGPAPWSPAVDMNTGAAAIYGPPDLGFPETGVLAEGDAERARLGHGRGRPRRGRAGAPRRRGFQPRPLARKRQPRPGFGP